MTPHFSDPLVTLYLGDCLEVMGELEADSVDAIVTDPPYGLEFMGKAWDKFIPEGRRKPEWDGRRRNGVAEDWQSAVHDRGDGKPGGPSFSVDSHYNPNTKCRVCRKWKFDKNRCRCEVPDWEPRIRQEAPTQYLAFQAWCTEWAAAALRVTKPGGYLLAFGGTRTHHRLVCGLEDAGWIIRDELDWIYASGFPKGRANLKPAHEPIVLARKPGPLRSLAIDACRIGAGEWVTGGGNGRASVPGGFGSGLTKDAGSRPRVEPHNLGRWPSNVLLSDPELFDEPNPYVVGSGADARTSGFYEKAGEPAGMWGIASEGSAQYADSGGYSRFFIIPKADRAERERGLAGAPKEVVNITEGHGMGPINTSKKSDGGVRVNNPRANVHPTVKPIDLMRHLVRLVTPVGGVVLDPFLGSGTTALAASEEGFRCIGIERELEYLEIAKGRLMATPMGLGLDHGIAGKAPPKTHPDLSKHQPKRRAAADNYSGGWAGTDEEPAA